MGGVQARRYTRLVGSAAAWERVGSDPERARREREWFLRYAAGLRGAGGQHRAKSNDSSTQARADVLPRRSTVPTLILPQTATAMVDRSRCRPRTISPIGSPSPGWCEYSGGEDFFWYAPAETEVLEEVGGSSATRLSEASGSIVCWRPCCSPTSWVPPIAQPSSAIARGASSSSAITRSCARCSRGTAARRSTRRATASSRRSTVPRVRSGARRRSSSASSDSASRSAPAFTPAKCETIDGKVGGIGV